LLLTLYARQFAEETRDAVTLALFGEEMSFLRELTQAYLALSQKRGVRWEMVAYSPPRSGKTISKLDLPEGVDEASLENEQVIYSWQEDTLRGWKKGGGSWEVLTRFKITGLDGLPSRTIVGFGIHLWGWTSSIGLRLLSESGLHVLRQPNASQSSKCLVDSSGQLLAEYVPPEGIARRGAIGSQNRRRLYDRSAHIAEDVQLEGKLDWHNRALDDVLDEAVEKCLEQRLQSLLSE
jgi:hypothetical protein